MSWPWSELGLPGPAELRSIRAAYAERLKTTRPEEDPEGFQRLHAAYQEASRQARRARSEAPVEPLPEPEAPAEPVPEPEGEAAEEPEQEAPQAPDWDFEGLFAQGEEEAREARRRRLEDLRRKNWARYAPQARQRRELGEEDAWPAVLAAVGALELLERSDAPLSLWRRFLESSAFLSVRADMDFVFLLEDFLERRPDLPPEVRRAIFDAYEECNASKYPAYKPLYRLLGVEPERKRRMARAKSGWRARWRSFSPWRKAALAACGVVLAVCLLIIFFLPNNYEPPEKEPDVPWTEQAPQWLEADYGEPFIHAASEYIFAPAAEPDLYFWAVRNSRRSAGWPGYLTNYPYVRVRQALESFAKERELDLELGPYAQGAGEAPGDYLLNLPLQGAEEDIAALGELVERLSREPWHQPSAATRRTQQGISAVGYNVYLCHRGLAFYHGYAPKTFDAEEALSLYAQAGPALCRWILEQSGLADRHMGQGTYVLQDREAVTIGDGTFFQVRGVDKDTGETRVQYLLASGGGALFCIPQEKMDGIRSVVDLYRGTPRTLELDKLGLILVTDQVPGE